MMITLKNVTKEYNKGNIGLEDVSLDIAKGEFVFIVGKSGSGKTTLMKLLQKELDVTSGQIIVNGQDYKKLTQRNLPKFRRQMGMVFQDFRLVPAFTVLENVFLSLHSAGWKINKKKLRDEINRISAEYRLSVNPDTEVWKLDLGQRQHVEILKILLDPQTRVMIFDEPTSVLAPHEVQAFLQMLSGFRNKGYGIFLITHKIDEILAVADRITILRQGEHVCTCLLYTSPSPRD